MKKLIFSIIFLSAILSFSQNTSTIGVLPDNGPALPATCTVGQLYFLTSGTPGLNQCATANTWTAAGSGASNATYQTTTAATAASAIALGAGATNNNSANAGAGAASLAMTLNINVGDFVIIFTDTQDTSLTLTDNGSGGGNTYLQLGQVATNRGKGIMWYVQSATVSASQVTVADAANAYSMSGATYVNVLGIGTPITPATGSTNSLTMSVTTLAANSLVVGCFQYNTATTFTPTSGSVVTQSFNGTNTVNTSMMSITTTTVGTYTLSATTNQGTPVWQGLAIELKASGAVNHNSPVLTLGGTGWNGSSSINELTTLQAVVPNVTNPVPVLTATPTFSVVNNGVFNNTANGPYISASINGSNPASEFTGVSRTSSQIQNSAIYGGITIPSFSTQFETHGLFGAIRNYSTTTYGVGGYFSALAGAASTKTFGANMIVMDGGFAATNLVGAEIDITQSNADSGSVTAVSNGLRILSNGTHRPASGIYIVGSGGTNDNFLAPLLIDDANSGDTNPTRMIYLIPPDNLNTTTAFQLRNHANNADVLTMSDAGAITPSLYQSQTNCSSAGGTCSAAQAGSVTIAAAATTVTVATTAVTANSQIFVQEDSSLGTKLSVTCNTTTGRTYTITTRTAGTSFVITASAAPTTNPACLSYFIVN